MASAETELQQDVSEKIIEEVVIFIVSE